MASVPSFRDAVIQQKPMLLDTLFTSATDSASGFDKHVSTCVALFSTPLEFVMPSKAPNLIMKCLEKAVGSLSSETIRPVYLLLSGIESNYLDILPSEILSSLQTIIIEVLSKLNFDNHLANLLCLAILAKFYSKQGAVMISRVNVPSSPKDAFEAGPKDVYTPARKFFSSGKTSKTLDLIVIEAITACSQRCQLSANDIIESLKLSAEIVDALDKKEKSSWFNNNGKKTKKLFEKVLRPDIPNHVQCEALNFLAALFAEERLSPEVIPNLQKYLLTSKADVLSANAIGQCIVRLDDDSIRELLQSILVLLCEKLHPCRDSLTEIDNALRLISIFREKIPTSAELPKAVLRSISSKVVSNMLRRYVTQVPGPLGSVHGHTNLEVCPFSYHEAHAQLHRNLAMMLLESALHASNCGVPFDPAMMTLLLEKQSLHHPARPASVGCVQRRAVSLPTPKVSLFGAVSTPRVDSISLNWRDSLIRELSRDADCRYESVVRMVGEICRDLESRCNESERPLREEKSRSRDLQARLESSEHDKSELELQARNHRSTSSTLQTERDRLANQVEVSENRLEELSTRLNKVHEDFEHAKVEAGRAAQIAIERTRQQDLAYLATMTGKDEMFEEQSLKLANAEECVEILRRELNCMKEQEVSNAERLNDSAKHIDMLNIAVSTSESRIQDLQDELIHTKEQDARNIAQISSNVAVIEELDGIILVLNNASDQKESLISTLRDQLQKVKFETSELRMQHETYISAKDAEIGRLDESNRSSNETWQQKLKVAHKNATTASEQSAATIASLHNKVEGLRKELEKRDREFAEAQELSSRLTSLMGATKHQRPSHLAAPRIVGYGEHDLPLPDAGSPDASTAKSLHSSSPSASSRAPKRIKRYLGSGTPMASPTKNLRPTTAPQESPRSMIGDDRVALADLGSTQDSFLLIPKHQKGPRHRGYQEPYTPESKEAGRLQEDDRVPHKLESDEESFGGGDIFTSTNQQQLSALRSKMPRYDHDETTTEF